MSAGGRQRFRFVYIFTILEFGRDVRAPAGPVIIIISCFVLSCVALSSIIALKIHFTTRQAFITLVASLY